MRFTLQNVAVHWSILPGADNRARAEGLCEFCLCPVCGSRNEDMHYLCGPCREQHHAASRGMVHAP